MRLPLSVFVAGTIAVGSMTSITPRDISIARVTLGTLGTLATADSVREFRGIYEAGFEKSWFHPCDAQAGDDTWWVTLTDVALKQRDSLATKLRGTPGPVFVRWRGTTSAKMLAGHMGRGSRYMLVHEVLELRPATEAGCTST